MMRLMGMSVAVLLVLAGLTIAILPAFPIATQDDEDDRTIALETRVAELEATIVALEATVAAADAAGEPEPAEIREYPRKVLPFGEAWQIGGWSIEIRDVNFDATEVIHEENAFVSPPRPGFQFVLIRLGATYMVPGEGALAFDVDMAAIAESGASYDAFDGCGFIPDRLDVGRTIAVGQTLVGNICYEVAQEDVASLVLYVEPGSQFAEGVAVGLSLHAET